MFKEILCVFVIVLLIGISIWSGWTAWTYYTRYRNSQASLSIYIDECGKLRSGFEDAKQLIRQLGGRNRAIAEAARKGLELINRKYQAQED